MAIIALFSTVVFSLYILPGLLKFLFKNTAYRPVNPTMFQDYIELELRNKGYYKLRHNKEFCLALKKRMVE